MQVPTLTQGVDPDAGVDRQTYFKITEFIVFIVFIVTKKVIQTKAKRQTQRDRTDNW